MINFGSLNRIWTENGFLSPVIFLLSKNTDVISSDLSWPQDSCEWELCGYILESWGIEENSPEYPQCQVLELRQLPERNAVNICNWIGEQTGPLAPNFVLRYVGG